MTAAGSIRSCLDQAEVGVPDLLGAGATPTQPQRRLAARNHAAAARLRRGGIDELAEAYQDTARRHDATAVRIVSETGL